MADESVYRVQFVPNCPAAGDAFGDRLRELGGMLVYGLYPSSVVVSLTAPAAAELAELALVDRVESVTGEYAVS
ncbi:hypothetical protein [Nocardia sp. NPDC005978]|uniref:hypothetical protein n=1 Tax=unclassified Nocardia TaxID=2637762 RepID=UPI0033A7B162